MKPKCGLPRRYPLCPRLAQGSRGHAPLTVHFLDGEQTTIGDRSHLFARDGYLQREHFMSRNKVPSIDSKRFQTQSARGYSKMAYSAPSPSYT